MQSFACISVCVLAIILAVGATPAIGNNENANPLVDHNRLEEDLMRKLNNKCHNDKDHQSCMRVKLFVYLNRIFKKNTIDINPYTRVIKNGNVDEYLYDPEDDAWLARSMDSEDETLGILMANKIWRFIRSRALRYKFSDNADFVVTTEPKGNLNVGISISPVQAMEEGRGKMKNLAPLLMVMISKMSLIGALLLKGLFLLAGKALIVSKIALLLSVIIALKKLLSQKKHVVEVPHHDSYSSGWARALDGFLEGIAEVPTETLAQEAHKLAFAAQKPA